MAGSYIKLFFFVKIWFTITDFSHLKDMPKCVNGTTHSFSSKIFHYFMIIS